jgi:hypothetical protein
MIVVPFVITGSAPMTLVATLPDGRRVELSIVQAPLRMTWDGSSVDARGIPVLIVDIQFVSRTDAVGVVVENLPVKVPSPRTEN